MGNRSTRFLNNGYAYENRDNYILFSFKDSAAGPGPGEINSKKSIESFFLKEFELENASFHVTNSAREREFSIQKLNISLNDLVIDQRPGKDIVSNKHVDLSIGEFKGILQPIASFISRCNHSIFPIKKNQ